MTGNGISRRRLLTMAGQLGPAALLVPGRVSANGQIACPPGQRLVRWETWTCFESYEFEINLGRGGLLGGAKGKVPVQRICWKAVCEAAPPPPPPPPLPPPKSGHYEAYLYQSFEDFWASDLVDARNAYFNVGLPSFLGFASNSALITMESTLASGSVSRLTAPLVRDQGGFVFADAAGANQFISQSMEAATSTSWAVSEIELSATHSGSGHVGFGLHLAGHRVGGVSIRAVAGSLEPGPGVLDPEATPAPGARQRRRRR